METQDRHITEILSAKCNYVNKLESMLKRSDYGDDINCCANNLFLASKLINRLECFCFGSSTIPFSVFQLTRVPDTLYSLTYAGISINGSPYTYVTFIDGRSEEFIVAYLLNYLNIDYNLTSGNPFVFAATALPQDVSINILISTTDTSVSPDIPYLYEFSFTLVNMDESGEECYNCIETKDLDGMYDTLRNLLK